MVPTHFNKNIYDFIFFIYLYRLNTQYHQRIIDELKLTISSLRSNVSNGETLGGIKDDSHHQQIEQLLEKNMKLEQEVLSLKEVKNENDRTELRQVIILFLMFRSF